MRSGAVGVFHPRDYPQNTEGMEYPFTDVTDDHGNISLHVKIQEDGRRREMVMAVSVLSRDDHEMRVDLMQAGEDPAIVLTRLTRTTP